MFSRFGHLTRIRLHANSKKEWLPLYAFITYDNIDSVRQCLMRKVSSWYDILIFFNQIKLSLNWTLRYFLNFRTHFTGQKIHVRALNWMWTVMNQWMYMMNELVKDRMRQATETVTSVHSAETSFWVAKKQTTNDHQIWTFLIL